MESRSLFTYKQQVGDGKSGVEWNALSVEGYLLATSLSLLGKEGKCDQFSVVSEAERE